jgi:nucleotide-binding universal stress UspA family protein
MTTEPLGRTVLVPIANPQSARPLLRCAARLAAADDGRVELVTTLPPRSGPAAHQRAQQSLAAAEAAAVRIGVPTRARIVQAADPAIGVLEQIDELDASLVLMGWRGTSSTTDVFGRLIDTIVGRSTVPLAIVRPGTTPYRRVLLPVSADHLLPGGSSGLCLAARLADRLRSDTPEPTTLLRTGPREVDLPNEVSALGDRVHHDPRRTDQAVAAFARDDDLIVAAVAPTVSGLRAATTHLAWAAPDATLLVAIDVGPTHERGLEQAVDAAGSAPPARRADDGAPRPVRIVVTARLAANAGATPEQLDRALRTVGTTGQLMAWWPAGDPRPHVRANVTVDATGVNAAIGRVMVAVHEATALQGAEITYDVDRSPAADPITLIADDLQVHEPQPLSEQAATGGHPRPRDDT